MPDLPKDDFDRGTDLSKMRSTSQGGMGAGDQIETEKEDCHFYRTLFGDRWELRRAEHYFWTEKHIQTISMTDYGQDWPFTRSSGTLSCIDAAPGGVARPYVIIEFGGIEYGLNGAAKGIGAYKSSDEVTKRDADGLFTIGNVHRLIEEGLALCRGSY